MKFFSFLVFVYIGFWLAAQDFAAAVDYDTLLGEPSFVMKGVPYYMPWRYLSWWHNMHVYVPNLFRTTYVKIFACMVFGILLLLLTGREKRLWSHGTAHWAEEDDLKKMELFSAHGVVVGMYDSPFTKKATRLVRWFGAITSDKKARGELAFEQSLDRKWGKWQDRLAVLRNRSERNLSAAEQCEYADLARKLESRPKYKPQRDNPYTVYPFVWFNKKLTRWYSHVSHRYLRDNSNKHMAVIAPTRSGKGVGLIIPTLLGGWDESVVVNDIKSENWGVTAGYRHSVMGHLAIKFEPTAGDGSSARWNPLDEIRIGDFSETAMAENIASVIADREGKGSSDHWISNATRVIKAIILHLKYAHYVEPDKYPNPPSLYDVASFLLLNRLPKRATHEEDGREVYEVDEDGNPVYERDEDGNIVMEGYDFLATLEELKDYKHVPPEGILIREWSNDEGRFIERRFMPQDLINIYPSDFYGDVDVSRGLTHPIVQKEFVGIMKKPPNEGGSIISTASTGLKEYLDPVLARNTACSDFCIDDMLNNKKPISLYLVVPPSDLLRLAPLFRLFFEMMVRVHTKSIGEYHGGQAESKYRHKCLLLMDEFSSLGKMESFVGTFSYIAGYGLKAFLICQGLPQINGIYTKDNQILMNCHLQIVYAPNDNETANYASAMLGKETILLKSESDGQSMFRKNRSWSEQAHDLMTADELKRLGDEELIVASGNPPVKTDKVKYYESRYFLDKLVDAPRASDLVRVDADGNPLIPNPYRERLRGNGGAKNEKKKDSLASFLEDFSEGRQDDVVAKHYKYFPD